MSSSSIGSDLAPSPSLTAEQLSVLFPFFLFLDQELRIIRCGPSIQKACPDIVAGRLLTDLFALERPRIPLTAQSLAGSQGSLFLFKHQGSDFWLRAQLLANQPEGSYLLLGSPWIRTPESLRDWNLGLSDFAIHDSTPELVQVSVSHNLALDDLRRVAAKLDGSRRKLRQALDEVRAGDRLRRLLSRIVATSTDAVAVANSGGCTEWINDSFVKLTGFSIDDIYGVDPAVALKGPQTDAGLLNDLSRAIGLGQSFKSVFASYRKNGKRFWNEMEVHPVLSDEGAVSNWVYVLTDVSAQRMTAARNDLDLGVTRIVAELAASDQAIPEILKTICERVDGAYGGLWWMDGQEQALRLSAFFAIPDVEKSPFLTVSRSSAFPPGEGLPGKVWLENGLVWMPDIQNSGEWTRKALALRSGLRSAIAFPVRISGVNRGVIEIFSCGAEDLATFLDPLVASLSVRIGQFIDRQNMAADRNRILSLLQSALDSTRHGVVFTDLRGSVIKHNQGWLDIIGGKLPVERKPWWRPFVDQFRHAEAQFADWKRLDSLPEQHQSGVFELADGRIFRASTTPLNQAGRVVGQAWAFRDISATVAQERERERLVATLNATLESTNDGILVRDLERGCVAVNQRFLEMWGIPPATVKGNETECLVPQVLLQLKDPDAFSVYVESIYRDPATTAAKVFELKDGRVFEVHSQPQILADRIIGRVWCSRDVSAQWAAHRALAESEDRYRFVTETAPDAILTFDASGVVQFANRVALNRFCRPGQSLVGLSVATLLPQGRQKSYSRLFRRLLRKTVDTQVITIELSLRDAADSVFPSEVNIERSRGAQTSQFTAIIRDISQRKAAEEQIRLNAKSAALANRAKSDFLANISHEIRTPLNAIVGLSEILRNSPLDREIRESIDSIWVSAESLLALTNDMIDISRIEAGQIDIEFQEFDAVEVAERAVDVLRIRAAAKSLPVYFFVEPSPPPLLRGDPNRIRQVLVNLLSNAIKFTDLGSVTLVLQWEAIPSGVTLSYSVTDTGIGISAADQERIFDTFYRAESPLTAQSGGAGLGLGICRAIASKLGGAIYVDSVPGKGSCFRFTLPAAVARESTPVRVDPPRVLVATGPERLQTMMAVVRSAGFAPLPYSDPGSWPRDTSPFQWIFVDEEWADLYDFRPLSPPPVLWLRLTGRAASPEHTRILASPLTPSRFREATRDLVSHSSLPASQDTSTLADAPGRILLIEDNPAGQLYLKKLLRGYGHKVDVVGSAAEATEILRRLSFDLVLLDLQLPDGSGLDVLRGFRTFEKENGRSATPVLVLSAHALSEFQNSAQAAGADDYITKPVRPGVLLRVVRGWLARGIRALILAQSGDLLQAGLHLLPEAVGVKVAEDGRFYLPPDGGAFDVVILIAHSPATPFLDAAFEAASPFANATWLFLGDDWAEKAIKCAGSKPVFPIPNSSSALNRLVRKTLCQKEQPEDRVFAAGFANHISTLAQSYVQRIRNSLPEVRSSLDRGDFQELIQFAHRLKGTGSAYGLPGLSALAAKLETAARGNDLLGARLVFEQLEEESLTAIARSGTAQ